MLSDCGGRGLRPDPPAPTGVNLLPASQLVQVQKLSCQFEELLKINQPGVLDSTLNSSETLNISTKDYLELESI